MNRPLVWVAVALASGVLAGAYGLLPGMAFPLVVGIPGLLLPFALPRSAYGQAAGAVLVFVAAGALAWNAQHAGPVGDAISRYPATAESNWILKGRVRSTQILLASQDRLTLILDVERAVVDGKVLPLHGRVAISWSEPAGPVFADEAVEARGKLEYAMGAVNPGVDGYEEYLRRQGVHTALLAGGPKAVRRLIPGRWWHPSHLASRLRQGQAERFEQCVPAAVVPFVVAVWLGDGSRMGSRAYETFVESGTAHVLSVSGVHMAILYASVHFVLRSFVRSRRKRSVASLLAVWVFALTAGAQVACVRAAVMISLYLLSDLLEREPDAPTALGLSAILLLLKNSSLIFDVGFQLSFLSIASILIFGERIAATLERLPYALRGSIATSLSAQLLSLPAAVYRFHVLPLLSPLANLLVIPLLTFVLWLCFATSVCAAVSLNVASLFGHALLPFVWLIRQISDAVAATRITRLTVVSPTPLAMALYGGFALALFVALKPGKNRRAAVIAAAGLVFLTWAFWRPIAPAPEVVFLDVGHGDSTFVRTERGTTLLVDGGNLFKDIDQGKRVVAPFLWTAAVTRLDYVAATHPDSDHIGGLTYIVDHFAVGRVLLPYRATADPREQPLLDACKRHDVPVQRLTRGDALPIAGGRLAVLHPPRDWPYEDKGGNNRSLVMRLEWSGPPILLPGDIQQEAEQEVIKAPCRADVLKAPHHGSKTSSTPEFVEAVDPRDCIVSTGTRGTREIADEGVMRRYADCGVRVWRTDVLGGIRLTSDGKTYALEGARTAQGYPLAPFATLPKLSSATAAMANAPRR